MYPLAKREQLESMLGDMAVSVRGERDTVNDRLRKLFKVGANRRALGEPDF